MKPSLYFSFLPIALIFFLFASQTLAANDIIQQTCRIAADKDPNVHFDFCTQSLKSIPTSKSANLFEIGTISLKLIKKNMTNTIKYIDNLMKKKPMDSFTKPRMIDCRRLYSDAYETLNDTREAYMSKRYGEATVKLSSVMDSVTTCEDGFEEKEDEDLLLKKRNGNVFQLIAIALCIVNMHP